MKKAKKILLMVCALALTAAMAVGGTLAYLTSQDAVTNTFTVGNVKIVLDETDIDSTETNKTVEGRDKANEYHLLPGSTYVKDPRITVTSKTATDAVYKSQFDSESCYLFVKVENEIVAIEAETTVAQQMDAKGWDLVQDDIYCYCGADGKPVALTAGSQVVVFDNFTIKGDVSNETLSAYAGKTIKVNAYAVQSAGFESKSASEIWTAAAFS